MRLNGMGAGIAMFDKEDGTGQRRGNSLLSANEFRARANRARKAARESAEREEHGAPQRDVRGEDTGSLLSSRADENYRPAADGDPRQAFSDERTVAADAPRAASPYRAARQSHGQAAAYRDLEVDEWRPLVDARSAIDALYQARRFILATTAAGMCTGLLLAALTPKLYYSSAEILIDPRDLKIIERELTPNNLPFDATLAIVENQIRIMTGRSVMEKVVDNGILGEQSSFPRQPASSADKGIGAAALDAIAALLDSSQDDPAYVKSRAIRRLYERTSVQRGEKSFVVNLVVGWERPEQAAWLANAITDEFFKFQADLQNRTASTASGELTQRLEELRKRVEETENAVERYKAENDLSDAQGRMIGDEELLRLNDQLAGARAATIALNARAASISSLTADDIVTDALPEQVSSSALADLRSQFAAVKQQYDARAVKLGPKHPQMLELKSQLESVRNEIGSEMRRINAAIQVDLKRAVQTEQDLAARLAQVKVRQSNSKGDLVELRDLERQASAERAVYESYLLRARETGELQNVNTANVAVLARAVPPLESSGSSRKLIAIGGTLAGFLGGIVLALLNALFRSWRLGSGNGLARATSPEPTPPVPPGRPRRDDPGEDESFEWYRRRRNPEQGGTTLSGRIRSYLERRNAAAVLARAPAVGGEDGPPRTPSAGPVVQPPASARPDPEQPTVASAPAGMAQPAMATPMMMMSAAPHPSWAHPAFAPVMPAVSAFPMWPMPAMAPVYPPAAAYGMQPVPPQAAPAPTPAPTAPNVVRFMPEAEAEPALSQSEFTAMRSALDDMRRVVSDIARTRTRRRA